jgi:A/G-specific adenine glycosylase
MMQKRVKFAEIVQQWGAANRRDFLWRHRSDAYAILVAELLVQRTRAPQAESVYKRFLERWPDISSLSHARTAEIRSVIRSLGLEYRAKRLRELSCQIVQRFESRIPDDLSKLKQLYGKGFGAYMAHAILCFAYDRDVPIVDKNVERILARVFSFKRRRDGHRDPALWQFAAELVPTGRAREYNWSLLDFGALVCTPKNPKCMTCPLLQICDYPRRSVTRL